MASRDDALSHLLDKEAIRELVLLYARGVDRNDIDLLRSLYTDDAVDNHADTYRGPAAGFLDFMARAMPRMLYSGHHICNHLIAVDGDDAQGEVYCIGCDVQPDGAGGLRQHMMAVRYIDRYRRCTDGKWRFAHREVNYDFRNLLPMTMPLSPRPAPQDDPSMTILSDRLCARGARD